MQTKDVLLALLLAVSPMAGAAEGAADGEGVAIPLDLTRPFELSMKIEVPSEDTPLGEISRYLDDHGFKIAIDVAYRQAGSTEQLVNKTLSGTKQATMTIEQLNAHLHELTRLAGKISANPTWTFKQAGDGS